MRKAPAAPSTRDGGAAVAARALRTSAAAAAAMAFNVQAR